jgi:hypothetical protein
MRLRKEIPLQKAVFLRQVGLAGDATAASEQSIDRTGASNGGPCSYRTATITDCFNSFNFAPMMAKPQSAADEIVRLGSERVAEKISMTSAPQLGVLASWGAIAR